ncbi:hypothetical protein ABK040_011744 [Willaertia magna]
MAGGHGAKMHFHGMSKDLLKKWKIPIMLGVTCQALLLWGGYEAYHFNYNWNVHKYAGFQETRHRGLKPPYETNYQPGVVQEYKVDWNSFREDVN